ncbi:hypothetical protein AUC47_11720 [Microbacterium sp. SZ1]|uniref:hypothetical protein n=1 Tax=Microbacterium sp. SZ1 TaxID=1849736 RepID=UPI000BBCA66A|nr:hypothetical protein [Microbacterium sp. SZ1]PCE15553.1 hypothetical protein AUC47_11720 [Microbacterium sp. SZ1]
MGERFTPEDAGYILYSEVIERLGEQFPTVPGWRLEQIVTAENEAITGGMLSIVPAEVETGAVEMLTREEHRMSDDDEVA